MLNNGGNPHKLLIVDKNFPRNAFYTTLFVSALLILSSIRYQSFELTMSLVIGIIISFCSSLTLWWLINYLFREYNLDIYASNHVRLLKTNPKRKSVIFAFVGIGKIIVLGLIISLVFKFLSINIYAFLIGISVVQIVVFSMMVSIVLVNMLNMGRGGNYVLKSHKLKYSKDVNAALKYISEKRTPVK